MQRLVQTEDPSLKRDPSNHALINTNSDSYAQYRALRAAQREKFAADQRIEKLEREVQEMHKSLNTIIELLTKKSE